MQQKVDFLGHSDFARNLCPFSLFLLMLHTTLSGSRFCYTFCEYHFMEV